MAGASRSADPNGPIGPNNPWMEIVGVVGDIKYSGLDAPPEPTYYLPYRQNPWNGQFVVVRTASDPSALGVGGTRRGGGARQGHPASRG